MTGLEALLSRFGLAAIFLGAGIEGETAVILGGVVAHRGFVPYPGAVAAAFMGSFVSDQLLFWAGRRYREHRWVLRWKAKVVFHQAMNFIERHPNGFPLAFSFVYGMRIVSPLAIGTSTISARRFLTLNAISAAVWATIFTTIGFAFAAAIERVFGRIRAFEHVLILAGIVLGAAIALAHLIRRTRRGRKRASPPPP